MAPAPGPVSGDPMKALQAALAGRYLLQGELGRGGMAIVYLAYEVALDRPVALKLLPPAAADTRWRERFLREARAAARLSHPNIVPIHAVDQVGEFVFFTMPYVDGETLLAKDYSRAEMIRALRIEAERWREREAFHNGGVAPGPRRWPRRVIYAALALVGLGAAVTLMELWPPEVGKLAMLLGAGTASMVVMVSVEEARMSWYLAAQFWLTVWQSRMGARIVMVAGWRLKPRPTPAAEAPEILMLRRPSFEYWRRIEAVRDLLNLVQAMEHRVASRIDGIRACLNPEAMCADDLSGSPLVDERMRQRLEQCRDRLQLVWRRLRAVQVKDSRKRLEAEFKMVEETCQVADELLGEVGGGVSFVARLCARLDALDRRGSVPPT